MKKGFQGLLPLFFCITCCYQSKAHMVDAKVDLITDTCKKTAHFDLCAKTLGSNPKSAGSDVTGLAGIIFEETLRYSNTTRNLINDLLKKTTDNVTKEALSICDSEYELASISILRAIQLLKSRSKSAYFQVQSISGDVSDEALYCEEVFKEGPVRESPLTARNTNLYQLSKIAFDIVTSILEIF